MLIAFQNKIIYMPGLPPNARWEKIEDYAKQCAGIQWREERTRAADGKDLALCVSDIDLGQPSKAAKDRSACYILYFQGEILCVVHFAIGSPMACPNVKAHGVSGNASSIPPRLPDLSSAMSMLKKHFQGESGRSRLTLVCLSYRGYWTSKGRPKEKGIRLDAAAGLDWISKHYNECVTSGTIAADESPARVILWGQSIGSGVATNLAAEHSMPKNLRLDSLILETPFTSIRAMLAVLYPQKWLLYKYLWPFLRNQLDSWKNLGLIKERYRPSDPMPHILILEAAKDELVPATMGQELYDRAASLGIPIVKKAVAGAFHNDTMFRAEGRRAASEYIRERIRS